MDNNLYIRCAGCSDLYTRWAMCSEITGSNTIHIMIATGIRGEIGTGAGLPWPKLGGDMRRFKTITTTTRDPEKKNAVIMGRRTWESLNCRALPGRVNVVLSSQQRDANDALFVSSVSDCCALLDARTDIESVFLIGGAVAVAAFMKEAPARLGSLYITYVMKEFPLADTFIDVPALEAFFPFPFYRTSDYEKEANADVHFALRWQDLSDI